MIKFLKLKIFHFYIRYSSDGTAPMWLVKETFYSSTKYVGRSRQILEQLLTSNGTVYERIEKVSILHNCTRERIRQIVAKQIREYLKEQK